MGLLLTSGGESWLRSNNAANLILYQADEMFILLTLTHCLSADLYLVNVNVIIYHWSSEYTGSEAVNVHDQTDDDGCVSTWAEAAAS